MRPSFSSGREGAWGRHVEVAEEIDTAAKELGWVNEALSAALRKLSGLE